MNVLLRNKIKWFLKNTDEKTKNIINDLLKEIERIEKDRGDREKRYQKKYDELNGEILFQENRFYEYFYHDEEDKK
jgi:hypothetical protein